MKKLLLSGTLFMGLILSLTSCHQKDISITITENSTEGDKKMKIQVIDNTNDKKLDFEGTYDVAGMDSTQKKALRRRVLDSLGHGNYPTD